METRISNAAIRRRYQDDRASIRKIAVEFNVSPKAIRLRLVRDGVFRGPTIGRGALHLDMPAVTRRYQDDHASIPELAAEFHVSACTIRRHLIADGVPLRGRTRGQPELPLDTPTIIRRYTEDMATVAAIADEMNTTPQTIRRRLKRAGIPLRPPPCRPSPDLATIIRRYEQDRASMTKIAVEMAISKDTVARRLRQCRVAIRSRNAPRKPL